MPSARFPGEHHVWRLSALLQKGTARMSRDWQAVRRRIEYACHQYSQYSNDEWIWASAVERSGRSTASSLMPSRVHSQDTTRALRHVLWHARNRLWGARDADAYAANYCCSLRNAPDSLRRAACLLLGTPSHCLNCIPISLSHYYHLLIDCINTRRVLSVCLLRFVTCDAHIPHAPEVDA